MPEDTKPNDQTADTSAPEAPKSASSLPPRAAPNQKPEPAKRRKKKEKKKYDSFTGYLWGEWIRPLGTIFIIMGIFRLTVLDWFDVPSGSMEPTIMTGDRIAVKKFTYGLRVPFTKETWLFQWGRPERGDLVVCYSPDEGDEVRLVKRVVAVPGDTIEMKDGRLWINGEEPVYDPVDPSKFPALDAVARSEMDFFTETVEGVGHFVMFEKKNPQSIRNFPKQEVPEDQYVIIGDNRDNSKDARAWNMTREEWGTRVDFMDIDRIHGQAFAVAFSLDGWSPRWGRTFKGIH
ncbi:MAG: signal peptidase I [Phycisphaerales bacterium]|nr:signal peptidase I [Phycisphaerales bacterium]MCB9835133.1 signal peptidase I [Phycisphaera sp.]